MALRAALSKVGFGAQLRWRSLLTPPAGQRKDYSWDFFQDGRLAFLYPSFDKAMDVEASGPNIFLAKSDLCHRNCVQGCIALKDASEMHRATETETWFSAAAKAAQRGPHGTRQS